MPPLKLPLVLMAVGVAVAFVTITFQPKHRPVSEDMDFGRRSERTVSFRADYNGSYEIRLEMDQGRAKELFPCTADPKAFAPASNCNVPFPAEVSLTLLENGIDISNRLDRSISMAGGRYGGDVTYTYNLAYVTLTKGRTYRLKAVALKEVSSLAQIRPKLVVDAPISTMQGVMMLRLLVVA